MLPQLHLACLANIAKHRFLSWLNLVLLSECFEKYVCDIIRRLTPGNKQQTDLSIVPFRLQMYNIFSKLSAQKWLILPRVIHKYTKYIFIILPDFAGKLSDPANCDTLLPAVVINLFLPG